MSKHLYNPLALARHFEHVFTRQSNQRKPNNAVSRTLFFLSFRWIGNADAPLRRVGAAVFRSALVVGFCSGVATAGDRIAFPNGYATGMVNYVSLDRTRNPDQTIRLFAPKAALDAAKAGKELPYGTVLVAEIYKAKKDTNGQVMTSALGRRIRGELAALAVMQKEEGWGESAPPGLRNGDWDFAIFSPQGERLVKKDLNECRACHAPLSATQHLFSLEHMQ